MHGWTPLSANPSHSNLHLQRDHLKGDALHNKSGILPTDPPVQGLCRVSGGGSEEAGIAAGRIATL